MKRKEYPLDADELIGALKDVRDHARGKGKITMRTITTPPLNVERIKPRDIRAIRIRLNMSQEVFARVLNVPVVTEASWERGRRFPSGAALRLLQIADRKPEALLVAAEG